MYVVQLYVAPGVNCEKNQLGITSETPKYRSLRLQSDRPRKGVGFFGGEQPTLSPPARGPEERCKLPKVFLHFTGTEWRFLEFNIFIFIHHYGS